jgi:phenylpropionate dioxygenase-like ring-hydroxylating dioxygenase large terminal subunit
VNYLRNAWYAAAWSAELTAGTLLARTFLEQPVVLFRDAAGRAAALFDRCPHRFAPLSRGRLRGDTVECGYHGLCFDRSGHCVHNPYPPGQIPPRAQVRSYELLERQGIVWIWMGEAAGADVALAPDYALIDDTQHWHTARGYLTTPANYLLGVDNLLDLTHAEYLHDGSLGSPALKTAHYEVKQEGPRVVHSNRWFDEGPIPPGLGLRFPTGGRMVSHWVNMRWDAPSSLWLYNGATFPGEPRESGLQAYTAHLLTPETATSTHYFFSISLDAAKNNGGNDAEIIERLRRIFAEEDSTMLAAIQSRMGGEDLWSLKPASLPGDAGATRVRQALEKLINAEGASHVTATG